MLPLQKKKLPCQNHYENPVAEIVRKTFKSHFYKPKKITTKKNNILKPDIPLLLIIQK